jgi:hypothetical protein
MVSRKRNEQQVHGIQHDFNRHKYDDGISSIQHPKHPDAEQNHTKENVVFDTDMI